MGRPSRLLSDVAQMLLLQSDIVNECHECHLASATGGYAQTYYGNAHRVVWEGLFGPTDLWVLHTCDNRRCINPMHLFIGTCQDNVNDMIAKGRRVKGKQSRALTEEQRVELNQLYAEGYSRRELREYFGVSRSTIGRYLGESYEYNR